MRIILPLSLLLACTTLALAGRSKISPVEKDATPPPPPKIRTGMNSAERRFTSAAEDLVYGALGGAMVGHGGYVIGKSTVMGVKNAAQNSKQAFKDGKRVKGVGYASLTVARPVMGLVAGAGAGIQSLATAAGGAVAASGQMGMATVDAVKSGARRMLRKETPEQKEERRKKTYEKAKSHSEIWNHYLDKTTQYQTKTSNFLQGHSHAERKHLNERKQEAVNQRRTSRPAS